MQIPRFGAQLEIAPLVQKLWGDDVVAAIQAQAPQISSLPSDIDKITFWAFGVDESAGYRKTHSRMPGDNDLNVSVHRKGQAQPDWTFLGNTDNFSVAGRVAAGFVGEKIKTFLSGLKQK